MNADREWQDQIRHSIRTVEALSEFIHLTPEEEQSIRQVSGQGSEFCLDRRELLVADNSRCRAFNAGQERQLHIIACDRV